ncbi:hypothetical protein [Desulfosporosinus sp.]|uniref:hypothetical protein n=1 Tax=Desulfosporosinus sp. TaxID=157907 RepID=UPI0025C47DFE|nr:hypothetical protein [Desulfosporosinus sp.]MBC2721501.1 hypothetical protein [Desulfosporosinus sp.]MBC2726376.1 hypothetical protein [Desulfosporosinus sp.]
MKNLHAVQLQDPSLSLRMTILIFAILFTFSVVMDGPFDTLLKRVVLGDRPSTFNTTLFPVKVIIFSERNG